VCAQRHLRQTGHTGGGGVPWRCLCAGGCCRPRRRARRAPRRSRPRQSGPSKQRGCQPCRGPLLPSAPLLRCYHVPRRHPAVHLTRVRVRAEKRRRAGCPPDRVGPTGAQMTAAQAGGCRAADEQHRGGGSAQRRRLRFRWPSFSTACALRLRPHATQHARAAASA